jgi:serine/threonine-protein kinase
MYVAADAAGNVFVTDTGTESVVRIDPTGSVTTIKSGLNVPIGLALDRDSKLYVVDSFSRKIIRIDAK